VPYGPGLHEAGIAPEKLITVAAARGRDVLWAMEEALRCPRRRRGDRRAARAAASIMVATRPLALAAAAGNTLGLILRTTRPMNPPLLRHAGSSVRRHPPRHGAATGRVSARRVSPRISYATVVVIWSMDRGVEQCGAAFRTRNGF